MTTPRRIESIPDCEKLAACKLALNEALTEAVQQILDHIPTAAARAEIVNFLSLVSEGDKFSRDVFRTLDDEDIDFIAYCAETMITQAEAFAFAFDLKLGAQEDVG